MKEKGKRKNDLRSSIILLLILLLLLITSTYAWFTANRTVTISTLDVHIEAQGGLQISTDAVNWKSIISTEDIKSGYKDAAEEKRIDTNQVPSNMEAVSTIGEIDENGNMTMYYGTVLSNETTGLDELTATVETDAQGLTGKYIAFDIFLKADSDYNLKMTKDSNVIQQAGKTETGIKQAARVAFCNHGTQPVGTATNTLRTLVDTDAAVYIWEPNSNLHTAAASAHAKSAYGINDLATNGTAAAVEYYGINSEITTGVELSKTNNGGDASFTKVTPIYKTTANEDGTMIEEGCDIFSITKGITKLRIYMWIEGQDVDCENTASGSDISFNLELQVKE